MKPILLKIQAFGSFSEEVEIDFRAFHNQPIFLIHGKTGAGKTTIFDAICYALYEKTTGMRDYKQMRSNFAPNSLNSFVEFTFQLQNRFYSIRREFGVKGGKKTEKNQKDITSKNKQKQAQELQEEENLLFSEKETAIIGEGTTPLQNTEENKEIIRVLDKFAELDSNLNIAHLFPTRGVKEFNETIENLLGITVEQFKQIVILPQGKFAELLHAQDKTTLLTQIFGAGIYQKIREQISEIEDEYKKQYQTSKQRVDDILVAAQCTDKQQLEDKLQNLQNIDYLQENINIEDEKYKQILSTLTLAESICDDIMQLEEKSKEFAILVAKKEEILILKQSLEKAQQAEKIKPYLDNVSKASAKYKSEKLSIANTKEEIEKLRVEKDNVFLKIKQHTVLEQEVKTTEASISEYKKVMPIIKELENLEKEIKNIARQIADNIVSVDNLKNEKKHLEDVLTTQKAEIQKLQEVAKNQQTYSSDLETFNKISEEFKNYQELTKNSIKLEKISKTTLDLWENSCVERDNFNAILKTKEQIWRNSQAFVLAEKLVENEPCIVCGSLTHPTPAKSKGEKVNDDALTFANEQAELATKNCTKCLEIYKDTNNNYQNALGDAEKAKVKLGEWALASNESIDKELRLHKNNLDNAKKAAKDGEQASLDLEKTQGKIQAKQTEIENNTTKEQQLKLQKAEKQISLQENQKQIPENVNISLSFSEIGLLIKQNEQKCINNAKKIKEEKSEQEKITEQENILNGSIKAKTLANKETEIELNNSQESLKGLLKQYDFSDENQAKNAFYDETKQKNTSNQIDTWKQDVNTLETTRKLLIEKIGGKAKPDIFNLKKEEETQKSVLETLRKEYGDKKRDAVTLSRQKTELDNYLVEQTKNENIYNEIKELSVVANGKIKESNKQKFETYVLAVFLDQVLCYANARLEKLSYKRYQLFRKNIVKGGKDTTLDFEILDTTVGVYRDVSTLSGGETFFTSLALALGLADIASSKKGAFKLDAVFIDEGFGTLDAETLDLAIRTLVDLEGGSRMIGIISHVAELKERIEAKLEVVKGKNGSKIV